MMKKITKITSSIGPASESKETLTRMVNAGVNVCRLNFSHDDVETQGKKIDIIREISAETGKAIGIIIDLQGPKHRIGDFEKEEKYPLEIGQKYILDNNPALGNSTRVQLPDMDVIKSLKSGDRVLLNDGKIELRVDKVSEQSIETTVIRGNEIWSRRGFNLPDTEVLTSILTQKDKDDLKYALPKNPDFIAVSFVQKPEDILEVRNFIKGITNHPVKIIAKIERPNAVARLEEIIAVSDAIMIARGDLAVEVPFEQVPAISRRIIRLCREMNKPVIMATQMLASMVENEFPTRAEISDISSSSYLRVDSTMTSEETTMSINPVLVVETMSKILAYADKDSSDNNQDWSDAEEVPENDWSLSIALIAELNSASAIVVFTKDGDTATKISCRRPDMPIIAVCNKCVYANQLSLLRGVFPTCDTLLFERKDAISAAKRFGVTQGNLVIVEGTNVSLISL